MLVVILLNYIRTVWILTENYACGKKHQQRKLGGGIGAG